MVPGLVDPGFGIVLVAIRYPYVEQVNLVVTGHTLTLIVKDQTGGNGTIAAAGAQRDRATNQPDAETSCLFREKGLQQARPRLLGNLEDVFILHAHHREILGQHHQLRALVGRFLEQPFRLQQVRLELGSRGHLDGCNVRHDIHPWLITLRFPVQSSPAPSLPDPTTDP